MIDTNIIRISDILYAHKDSSEIALRAPGQVTMTYERLYAQVQEHIQALAGMGVTPGDRVALVLPEGLEMAIICLTVTSCAVCLPVNPAYVEDEFARHFSQCGVTILITLRGNDTPSRLAAERCGARIIELEPLKEVGAGSFRLHGQQVGASLISAQVEPDSPALILTTSGTTSRPKIVPLTHRILCMRARARIATYQIVPADRLLNIMPMFHSSSLTYMLMSLMAGASVICPPRFYARDFFQWIDECEPTWCTGAASMYQTALVYAPHSEQVLANQKLRFLRTGAMALPTAIWEQMEATFGVPVLQAYSSTESGEITTNPLPPGLRKLGSVGLPINSEVGIVDDSGQPLPRGGRGEVVVRGPSVITGYENDPESTAKAFLGDWYRTGDLGYFDEDGYLFLLGRLKEAINRGGEKIFPAEIETVLLGHPMVKEAVAFGVPDTQLGEVVGAAVILKDQLKDQASGTPATSRDLRTYCSEHLAYFKVPQHLVITESFPYGANGKLARRGLANHFGLTAAKIPAPEPTSAPPTSKLEEDLAALWGDILGHKRVGIHDEFRSLGGDSLSAARLVTAIREQLHINVVMLDLFDLPTVAEQVKVLADILANGNVARAERHLVPIRPQGTKPPLFCFHALNGGVYIYRDLLPFLSPDQPVYGLQAIGIDGLETPLERVEDMARYHLERMRLAQPDGPYFLCGYSFGGNVALEVARMLHDEFHQAAFLLIIDDHIHVNAATRYSNRKTGLGRLQSLRFALLYLPVRYKGKYLKERFTELFWRNRNKAKRPTRDRDEGLPPEILRVKQASKVAGWSYNPRPYDGPTTYLRARDSIVNIQLFKELRNVFKGGLTLIDIPGNHSSLMHADIESTTQQLNAWLARSQSDLHKQS